MTRTLGTVGGAAESDSADDNIRAVTEMLMAAQRPKMKRDELARAIGMARSVIYSRLGGHSAFYAREVRALAAFFDVPVAVFYAGPDALLGRPARTLAQTGRETRKSLLPGFRGTPGLTRLAA